MRKGLQGRIGANPHKSVQPLWAPLLPPGPPPCLPFLTPFCFSQPPLNPARAYKRLPRDWKQSSSPFPEAGPTGAVACVGDRCHGPPHFWGLVPSSAELGEASWWEQAIRRGKRWTTSHSSKCWARQAPSVAAPAISPPSGASAVLPTCSGSGRGTCVFPAHPKSDRRSRHQGRGHPLCTAQGMWIRSRTPHPGSPCEQFLCPLITPFYRRGSQR